LGFLVNLHSAADSFTIQMSHHREFGTVGSVVQFVVVATCLLTTLFFVIWISVQLEQAGTPYRTRKLRAIADEEEVMMDIIRVINRYEFSVVPELPWDLQEGLVLTKEVILKPLDERLRRRQKLLDERKQRLQ
jgi:hypothetical protein